MKSKTQLEKETFEKEVLKVVFDESDHLRGGSFEEYLKSKGKQNLGKQIEERAEEDAEVTQKMTIEIRQYEEAVSSGFAGTFSQWQKTIEAK